jgi:hypothetical protein
MVASEARASLGAGPLLQFLLASAIGFAVGWICATSRPLPPPHHSIDQISILQPDPTEPLGYNVKRFRVDRTNTERGFDTPPQAGDWGVLIFFADGPPYRQQGYWGQPLP